MFKHTIAIVSVYQENTALLDTWLRQAGYQTLLWTDPYSAYPMIRSERPDLVLLDLWPKYPATGAMLLMLLHLDLAVRHVPILVCIANPRIFREAATPPPQPFVDVLLKPFDLNEVGLLVQRRIDASPTQLDRNPQEAPTTL